VTEHDDPYAPPSGDAPVRPATPPGWGQPPGPPPPWGTPTGPPAPWGAPPPVRPMDGVAVAALVLGLLALVTFFTVVGGLLLGTIAVALGARSLARARRASQPRPGLAVAGLVLGLLGALLSAGLVALLSDELSEYRGCMKESLSVAADQACRDALERDIEDQFT
jgi:hypothetical protein